MYAQGIVGHLATEDNAYLTNKSVGLVTKMNDGIFSDKECAETYYMTPHL